MTVWPAPGVWHDDQVNMNMDNISADSDRSNELEDNILEAEVEYAPIAAPNNSDNSDNDETSYEDDEHCSIQLQAIESDEHLYETIDVYESISSKNPVNK